MKEWLGVYRDRLQAKERGDEASLAEAGPLVLGRRLMSSKSPSAAYSAILYGKGTWVLHMLRTMLREEKAAEPDARFVQLLRALAENYRYRGLSTADLQREVEKLMTKEMDLEGGHSMDWFFDQWVYGIEIPRFSTDFKVAPQGKRFVVTGTLKQKDTASTFIARVPIYGETARGRLTLLGTVVTSGEETKFRFTADAAPRKLVIDPHQTVLAFAD
jgi:aminopeptidase N